jgi:hypothetical protein
MVTDPVKALEVAVELPPAFALVEIFGMMV